MMKKGIEVTLLGQRIVIHTTEEKEFVEKVAERVNHKLSEVGRRSRGGSSITVALLACMNLAGECLRIEREGKEKKSMLAEKIRSVLQRIDELGGSLVEQDLSRVAL